MAFRKLKEIKGVECDYWRICTGLFTCMDEEKTIIRLGLYQSKEARDKSLANIMDSTQVTVEGIGLTKAEMYVAISGKEKNDEGNDNLFYGLGEY